VSYPAKDGAIQANSLTDRVLADVTIAGHHYFLLALCYSDGRQTVVTTGFMDADTLSGYQFDDLLKSGRRKQELSLPLTVGKRWQVIDGSTATVQSEETVTIGHRNIDAYRVETKAPNGTHLSWYAPAVHNLVRYRLPGGSEAQLVDWGQENTPKAATRVCNDIAAMGKRSPASAMAVLTVLKQYDVYPQRCQDTEKALMNSGSQ